VEIRRQQKRGESQLGVTEKTHPKFAHKEARSDMDYEVDFLPVGDSNGDAICLRYGTRDSFWVHVVDGGFTDTADTVVSHIRDHYGKHVHINHMVLSHADNDHACGLVGVLKEMDVQTLWMNRPWLYAPQIIDQFHGNWTLNGLIREIMDVASVLAGSIVAEGSGQVEKLRSARIILIATVLVTMCMMSLIHRRIPENASV
jgi:ribonuclease BN (tRNA processing enzyme)